MHPSASNAYKPGFLRKPKCRTASHAPGLAGKSQGRGAGERKLCERQRFSPTPTPTRCSKACQAPALSHYTASSSTAQLPLAAVSCGRRASTQQKGLCKHSRVNREPQGPFPSSLARLHAQNAQPSDGLHLGNSRYHRRQGPLDAIPVQWVSSAAQASRVGRCLHFTAGCQSEHSRIRTHLDIVLPCRLCAAFRAGTLVTWEELQPCQCSRLLSTL